MNQPRWPMEQRAVLYSPITWRYHLDPENIAQVSPQLSASFLIVVCVSLQKLMSSEWQ